VISYRGVVAIAQVAMVYGLRIKPITGVQHAEKYSTAGVERREGHPSKAGWRVVPPTLPYKSRARGVKLTWLGAIDGAVGTL
jgi:hypothetical protein